MTEAIIFGGNDNHHLKLAQESPEELTDFALAMDRYGVILTMTATSQAELEALSSELPTDTHLVTYIEPTEGDLLCDAVRAYKKVDIFDCYHDSGLRVLSIKSGFGSIKPKLFTDAKKAS